MTDTKAKNKGGRPPVHGGYSLMVRAGELPRRRTCLRAYLTAVREGLVHDLARSEADLTTVQRVLIDRAISLLSIIRCVEEHIRETGVFKGPELAPVLAKSYCTYSGELRRVLETLGLDEKKVDDIPTIAEVIKQIDDEEAAAKTKAQDPVAGAPRTRQAGRSQDEEGPEGQAAGQGKGENR